MLTPIEPDLPVLLRALHAQLNEGGVAALRDDTLQAIGPARWIAPATLGGALALGGVELAHALIAAAAPQATPAQRVEALRLTLGGLLDAPEGSGPAARWLIGGFGLADTPETLPDRLRAEFLLAHGPAEQLAEAVQQAMRHERWASALTGLVRLRTAAGAKFPRQGYGLGSLCLHHLGRYAEAERWVEEGVGPEGLQQLAVPPLRTEAELLARWGERAHRPVATVLCTTFNHERYIDTAIHSFLAQDTEHPFEIVIHDDASTDCTAERIRAWQRRYPTLIRPILQTENQKSKGGMRHFHLALAEARGEFIAICEGDDYWIDPGKLQRQLSFLIAHPQFSCSAHNYRLLTESTAELRPWSSGTRDFVVSQDQMMSNQVLIWGLTLVFRNSFAELPPERFLAAFGDQLLISYLGTLGPCAYMDTLMGAVRRVNAFSSWMPLPEPEKERRRVRTWLATAAMQQRLGNARAARELRAKVDASPLDGPIKATIAAQVSKGVPRRGAS